jgi:hypothetical protein
VAALVHGIAEVMEDGLLGTRPDIGAQIFFAEQLIDRASGGRSQKFAYRIRPVVGTAGLQEQGRGAISAIRRLASIGALSGKPPYFA